MKRGRESNDSRLCDAADEILRAIESSAGMEATVDVVIGFEPCDDETAQAAFTGDELSEAMSFLTRLGVIRGATEQPPPMPGRRVRRRDRPV